MSKQGPEIKINVRRCINDLFIAALLFILTFGIASISAQTVAAPQGSSIFQVGERLTYNISFGKIANAGYAELEVVSRGKIRGRDAVEIHSKIKTLDVVSAA